MFGFGDPQKRLKARYASKQEEARNAQRSGNMPLFARLSAEAEEIGKRLDELREVAAR